MGVYVLKADLVQVNIQRRRRAQASGEFAQRYAVRAGSEGTNSELKRAHGLGRLRVRGGRRVRLAVYLKALACNIKRMISALLAEGASGAGGGQPRKRWRPPEEGGPCVGSDTLSRGWRTCPTALNPKVAPDGLNHFPGTLALGYSSQRRLFTRGSSFRVSLSCYCFNLSHT
jgi:hypothetical protein